MGNCISRKKKNGKDGNGSTHNKPQEDVTYASIDHGNTKGPSRARTSADDDCDYATVYVPAALAAADVSECSSKDEGAEDYVLMG
ncbi:uncharacterized protein LOC120833870 [Gasterosteus aculeatus]|uniref:uncharacterized protein si:ch211-214p13.7 n=1 Tax=Gasterosteus aculeatus aculeatus TaxID=481459 RepID=UPI001A99CC58|nr:uncharacterized protein si:ch211-214p13.7 [Gasterosteus aculeatus aculeatus]